LRIVLPGPAHRADHERQGQNQRGDQKRQEKQDRGQSDADRGPGSKDHQRRSPAGPETGQTREPGDQRAAQYHRQKNSEQAPQHLTHLTDLASVEHDAVAEIVFDTQAVLAADGCKIRGPGEVAQHLLAAGFSLENARR